MLSTESSLTVSMIPRTMRHLSSFSQRNSPNTSTRPTTTSVPTDSHLYLVSESHDNHTYLVSWSLHNSPDLVSQSHGNQSYLVTWSHDNCPYLVNWSHDNRPYVLVLNQFLATRVRKMVTCHIPQQRLS